MSQDGLAVMDGGKCILQLRGVRPFLSDKFDITKHPNYKYLSTSFHMDIHSNQWALCVRHNTCHSYILRTQSTKADSAW